MPDFVPTYDWQIVPPDAVCPTGLQYRIDPNDDSVRQARLALEPDLDEARRFLELLDPDAERFVLQTFDDGPQKSRSLAKTWLGTLDELASPLARLQGGGAGVFVTINSTVGGRRRPQDVERVRAGFVDLDGAPLDPVMSCSLEPHVAVESSPGKFHAYWIVEGLALEQFTPVQKAIAQRFGGDPKVCDLPRVMRMPGFWHQKGSPFRTRIVQVNERLPYSAEAILAAFPPVAGKAGNGRATEDGEAQAMADLVRDVLTAGNYHDALRNLAWRLLAGGTDDKDVVRILQGMMDACTAPRDDRFSARYNDIPRAVESAKRKLKAAGIGDLTDDGLALHMGREWEPDSRYCAEWARWIFWHGDRWEMDRTKLHLTRTRAWMRAKAAALIEVSPRMAKKAAELRDDKTIYAIDRLVTSNAELACTADNWDQDPMLLGGPRTIDLRTGEDRDPSPTDLLLKRVACAPAPAGTTAPTWDRFLDEITAGDRDLQAYMQRLAGYFLTGSSAEHVFVFGYGAGANGKSTYVETVRWVLGDYSTTIGSEVLMWSSVERHPTELAKLRAVRLAVASEIERGKVWAESKIKCLTGGDQLQARFMRQDFFTFTPQFKLMIIGNHKPSLRAVDEAIKRRMHLVPFTVTIPPAKRDKDLGEKLKAEGPAILRWMIDGCLAWQRRGLMPPKSVQAATEDYLAGEDSFALWIENCARKDPTAWEPASALWDSWRSWANNAGEFAGSQKAFANLLTDHGFAFKKTHAGRGYIGIKLHSIADAVEAMNARTPPDDRGFSRPRAGRA
jgi:putative DNA primase/helicase